MSIIESKLKEESLFHKELFKFNGSESQLKHIKELFTNLIQNSKSGSQYFIDFLKFYATCRPHQRNVSKELVECVYSNFPEQINGIQNEIKEENILTFIIFPDEFLINEDKEQNEMFLLLQKDDVDRFISFLSKNPKT